MKYRQFGQLDLEVSALGFGLMRLPTLEDDKIDEERAIDMIRYAIDNGINYLDTAWNYHGGESEKLAGKALKDGYRQRTYLATKLPVWLIESRSDMDDYLNQQLENLQTDYIDFYLLHTLNQKHWHNLSQFDVGDWLERVKAEGKVKHIGFSFHDNLELFREIIDYHNWDFCQIQYNYLDIDFQAGKKGLKYAADKGLGVVIMEPLRGGSLANPPAAVNQVFTEADENRTPVDWALQWLWNQPGVSVVLSGMSTEQQLEENINSAGSSGINSLTEEELVTIKRARKEYEKLSPIGCTGCGYCLPCPNGVHIPRNFDLYNEARIYDQYEEKKNSYQKLDEKLQAGSCIACGECEPSCPQNLPIIELLKDVANYFD